jgi:pheromone shutdown protein TraB
MDPSIKAGVSGFLLAIVINLLSPVYLDLVPSFLVAILVIYIFRLGTLKDGLVAAFMTYIFTDGILSTIALAMSYFANELYPSFNVDIWTMLSPMVSAATAVIAGYIGIQLAQKRRRPQELPPLIPPQSSPAQV